MPSSDMNVKWNSSGVDLICRQNNDEHKKQNYIGFKKYKLMD